PGTVLEKGGFGPPFPFLTPDFSIRPRGFEPLTFGSGDQRSIRAELRALNHFNKIDLEAKLSGNICVTVCAIVRLIRPLEAPLWPTNDVRSLGRLDIPLNSPLRSQTSAPGLP